MTARSCPMELNESWETFVQGPRRKGVANITAQPGVRYHLSAVMSTTFSVFRSKGRSGQRGQSESVRGQSPFLASRSNRAREKLATVSTARELAPLPLAPCEPRRSRASCHTRDISLVKRSWLMESSMISSHGEVQPHRLGSPLLLSLVRRDSRYKLRQRSSPDQYFPKAMDPGPLLVER